LKPEIMLPAPGQGALGIQCRADDTQVLALLRRLDNADTRAEVTAERLVLEGLGGGCQAPIGALGRVTSGRLKLSCGVFSLDGGPSITIAANPMPGAPRRNVTDIVRDALQALRDGGAEKIIAQYR
jgi:hydroxymethylbilane synthase